MHFRMLSSPAADVFEAPSASTVSACRASLLRQGTREVLVEAQDGRVLGLLHAEDVARLAARVPGSALGDVSLREV